MKTSEKAMVDRCIQGAIKYLKESNELTEAGSIDKALTAINTASLNVSVARGLIIQEDLIYYATDKKHE